ncbi:adenine phosphoribosyltransferase [Idiomarina sp. MD25a]|uniref:adenine phosphoribosyltransferase n=1 Tax=Idiomarina sp. MD25a TaxID=1889913 RepID=UPI0008F81BBD|nr:adenine phosphoribosyltransferase [Idiomarina sp. MD25a]OIN01680.1 adenine phosphoribosyltransferase [Idiomarina sp. MD25a]
MDLITTIRNSIRAIPDYPKPGIIFRDISPLLQSARAFQATIEAFAQRYEALGIDQVAAVEARGFIFGAALAQRLGCGLTLLRKPGKLPGPVVKESYALEYGEDALELQECAFKEPQRVVLMDDLLATGGTVAAAAKLLSRTKAELIEAAFVITLDDLPGEQKLRELGITCYTLCRF